MVTEVIDVTASSGWIFVSSNGKCMHGTFLFFNVKKLANNNVMQEYIESDSVRLDQLQITDIPAPVPGPFVFGPYYHYYMCE